jgi:hypothetical protein
VIRNNEYKELALDKIKFSIDGCFEKGIVENLKMNR